MRDEKRAVDHALWEISQPIPVPDGWTVPRIGYVFSSLGTCRSTACRREIAWFRTPTGQTSPHDRDGVSHFATCPAAERFRRRRSESRKEGT